MNNPHNETMAIANLRVPPHSIESECSLLGALLLNNQAHGLIVELIKPHDFYRHEHQEIFKVIAELIDNHKPADVITVNERLASNGRADDLGGIELLEWSCAVRPQVRRTSRGTRRL